MRRLVLPILILLTTAACADDSLPAEAFGVFADTNEQAFDNKLNVSTNAITLFVGVSLPGAVPRPLECRARVADGVKARMALQLDCGGERIAYNLEFRSASSDWVVTEDGASPQIFVRRSTAETPAVPNPVPPSASSSPVPPTRELLQGQWVADEDPKSHMEFRGDSVVSWYGEPGQSPESGTFAIGAGCADDSGIEKSATAGDMLYMNGLCYVVENVDANSLSITYLARGNTLLYNRVKK